MERILSKDEISDLLNAVQQGEIDTESTPEVAVAPKGVTRIDLVRPPSPGRWKIPNLDIIFDAFGSNFVISLTNRLQRPVAVKLEGIESLAFEKYLNAISAHCAIGVLGLDPLKSGGLLVFDDQLSFTLLEVQLGGAQEGKVVFLNRPLTAIELNLIKGLMEDSCADLGKAFLSLEQLRPSMLAIENNPRLVNIVTGDAGVLVARFTVTVDNLSGGIALVIPHASLDPLREKLRETVITIASQRSETWPEQMRTNLQDMTAELAAQVGEVTLRMRDILNFQVGDVIDLGCAPSAPLKLLVEGKTKFKGVAGLRNGSKAVRIESRITNGVHHGKI